MDDFTRIYRFQMMSAGLKLLIFSIVLLLPAAGCGPKTADLAALSELSPPDESGIEIRWYQSEDEEELSEQRRWHAAVGSPVLLRPALPEPPAPLDSLAVLCWNTHVGGGAINYLIRQLKTGVLTAGRPVDHFVILLQETFRDGTDVPPAPPPGTYYADDIFPTPDLGERMGVTDVGHRHGLYTYYVPSMRNGDDKNRPEDRGNAILSTLPLDSLTAWELPIRIERRVAIGAAIEGVSTAGEVWRLFFTNVHLDLRTNVRSIVRSMSGVRRYQIGFILDNQTSDSTAVFGGDFNTWFGERKEPAVMRVREDFPIPERLPTHGTLRFGAVLERQTDFLFFRLPQHWRAGYRRIDDTYGSDHYPLLGWIVFGEGGRDPEE
jgi:endonuclease/exonuclease/phosphatase family metal-dependent hydrolase